VRANSLVFAIGSCQSSNHLGRLGSRRRRLHEVLWNQGRAGTSASLPAMEEWFLLGFQKPVRRNLIDAYRGHSRRFDMLTKEFYQIG